jgi:hypothetical protein|tara:strand:- start:657 stop:1130 length:474 start_codon:yes stop_codon:yes gene_type:complete
MAKKVKYGNKQVKVWSYKVDHPLASASEVAKATNTSYGYVHKLFQKIGTPIEVFEAQVEAASSPASRSYSRDNILDIAKEYVTKDRAADHGDMQDNFQRIADYWNTHLGLISYIKDTDVAVMMSLLKVARIHSNTKNPDNWIDACGYMSCGGELASK